MTLEKHQNLRANVGRLWFAGEANSAEYFGFLQGGWFEGQEVGMRIAAMLGTTYGTNDSATLEPMVRYEVLRGTTNLSEYNAANGWKTSSFVIYESDE
jgi:polyamine oxidase